MSLNKINILLFLFLMAACGSGHGTKNYAEGHQETWAERLVFPSGKKVIILHVAPDG